MRRILAILVALALVMPAAFAIETGQGIGISVSTEPFKPLIWMCDSRLVWDDGVEPGRTSGDGQTLVERINSYAFEGEQVSWKVLVMDKNGIEKVKDVFVTVGSTQGNGKEIEANCDLIGAGTWDPSCNAMIGEEKLIAFESNTMAYYTCTLTVEPPTKIVDVLGTPTEVPNMHGQFWIVANVEDLDGQIAHFAENEFWFFNPTVQLDFNGLPVDFGTVRPGTSAYSNTITVFNKAEAGSGVMLD
ncbi:MAG: hypothetical protein V1743_01400, partial [Nanoarchaeota archaeon]